MRAAPDNLEHAPSVLVVDDVKANLVALESLLSDMGCDVVLAQSGNDALRQLLRREFAVMLLDVQMPDMDGYEVAEHARQNPSTRDVPIIFLTANDSQANVLRGYGSGAVDFLSKPLNAPILRSKVRIFLDLFDNRRQIARAYRELQATQAQLVQSAKLASLGELVAGVAHEINNPLAFALSHLATAERALDLTEAECGGAFTDPAREHWQRARNRLREMGLGLERIRELVLKLRTFSRLDEGELKRVSVKESVESVLTIMNHRIKDGVRVETRFGEPDVIDCYPALLNQAVMNLVANAIDALDGEGTVSITTGIGPGGAYEMAVSDTGPGIPEHLRQRVLEPFFTTKDVGQGTGLGLSITDSIVKKHGGSLELRDAPGGGALAIIRIPITAAPR